jgi:hypothetical protein
VVDGQLPRDARTRFHRIPPVESSVGPRPEDAAINASIAIYNSTGNTLAAWSILQICIQHQRPLPEGIAIFFESMASKLLDYSATDRLGAREDVADIVLGTTNQGGGPSVFQQYKQILEKRNLLRKLERLMDLEVVAGSKTQNEVYEAVANETGREIDYLKKLHEEYDREMDTLSIRTARTAKKRAGVVDL